MYGLVVNRIPGELNRISDALQVSKHAIAFQYLNYIFDTYLDEGTRQFCIHDFLSTRNNYDGNRFGEILEQLEQEVSLGTGEANKLVVAITGGNTQSALSSYYRELFQSGLRAMLASLNGLHDVLQVSMESLKIKPRMYLSHYILEYDTTGTIFDDHDEVIEVAIKCLSELEYF